jgi:hypothetical protein
MKSKGSFDYRLMLCSVIFGAFTIAFSQYWMLNSGKYVHEKGDNYFMAAEVISVISFIYFITLQIVVKRQLFVLPFIFPITLLIVSTILGLVFEGVSGKGDQLAIFAFGIIFSVLNVATGYIFWRK